jgi:sugar phosphate isomerase/epimerase
MGRQVKVAQGTWCMAFGLEPTATLEQALQVIAGFGYDGVELAGFFDHATIERFPDERSRDGLAERLRELGLEPVGIAPAPHGGEDLGVGAWSLTDDPRTIALHRDWWRRYIDFAGQLGIGGMRIDPGANGPLPYDADYERVWARVVEMYRWLADEGAQVGCTMLWEMESGQPFNKPSEIVKLLDDVDHPNCKLLYDTGHMEAATVVGHNQVQPQELLEGGQLELLPRLKGRIGHVHLCDTDGDVAQNLFARKIGFGRGRLDFDALLPALVDCYDGEWWGMDAISMSEHAWGDSWTGLAFIRDVVARHVAAAGAPA